MRRLAPFGWILAAAAAIAAAAPPGALGNEAQTPYEILRTAPRFALGKVGFDEKISREEAAFNALLRGKEPLLQFRRLFSEATLEGRLYALLGFKLLNAPAYREHLQEMVVLPHAEAWCSRGCVTMHLPISAPLKRIDGSDGEVF